MTSDREVSLPFTPTAPSGARRHGAHAESSAARLQVVALLERHADDIAARWRDEVSALLPSAAPSTPAASDAARESHPMRASALLLALTSSLADDGGSTDDDVWAVGLSFGTAAFETGTTAHQLLLALDRLEAMCLEAIEDAWGSDGSSSVRVVDAVRICRRLHHTAATITAAAARGYSEATDKALQERFRRLRHDLRNPLGTIRSALSLMSDETVPEEARRSPRFRTMIERNTVTLDQMIVARLSDAEAHAALAPASSTYNEGESAPIVVGESRDDLARPRQRDDRQTGPF